MLSADKRAKARWSRAPIPIHSPCLAEVDCAGWLAELLARRGVGSPDEAKAFLAPSVADFHDPFDLDRMAEAVDRLVRAQKAGERVAIVGDYDVDGISATALLLAVFKRSGINAVAFLPNRFKGGYGFQSHLVEQAAQADCGLIVTADCGSTADEAFAVAATHGIDVIVTDHHLSSNSLPDQIVEINPKGATSTYPFRDLSGAGVAFKLSVALTARLGLDVSWEALLRIACLGTICDLVPLVGENRTIASLGLAALPKTRSIGLRALMNQANLKPPYRATDIGFRIGPRLNAAGRLEDPTPALELLMTKDQSYAGNISSKLEELNKRRQREELRVVEAAEARFSKLSVLPCLLVAWDADWHQGVVGIAAGRIARKFHRPTILLSVSGDSATGSGRSIPAIHLHEFLSRWQTRYERFGGHAQAIGLTVGVESLDDLEDEWQGTAAGEWATESLVECKEYELEFGPGELSMELLAELERLQPFGMGNRQPIIRVGPLELKGSVRQFGQGHLSAEARGRDGGSVRLLGWGWQERLEDLAGDFEVLGCIELDRYLKTPVLRLVDARSWSGSTASA